MRRTSSTATYDVKPCGNQLTADFDIVAEAEAILREAALADELVAA